jgi:hypothetical protein
MTRTSEPRDTKDERDETMTQAEVKTALDAKLATMTTDALIDICCKLARDYTSHSGMVSDACLAQLQKRLPSDKFIAFCDELYAAMG